MDDSRAESDPGEPLGGPGLRRFEAFAQRVLDCFAGGRVARGRDVIEIRQDAPDGLVVLVTPESVEIRLPTVEWTEGAHGPAASSRLWKRLRWARLSDRRLQALLAEAAAVREGEFTRCRYCGQLVPPEHRHAADVCHGCAERHLGIVH